VQDEKLHPLLVADGLDKTGDTDHRAEPEREVGDHGPFSSIDDPTWSTHTVGVGRSNSSFKHMLPAGLCPGV
jgi:hypothetical protein